MFNKKEIELLKAEIERLKTRIEELEIKLTPKQYFGGK